MIEVGIIYQIKHPRQRTFEGTVTAIDGDYAVVDIGDQKNRLIVGDRYVKGTTIEVLIAKSRFTEIPGSSADLGVFDGMTHDEAFQKLHDAIGIADKDVFQVALNLRRDLEHGMYKHDECMREFPRGSCGSASEILQRRLATAGHGDFEYVCRYRLGPNGANPTHAWLEKDGLIVDITADQFEGEGQPPVIVSRSSPWHAAWLTTEQLQGE